MAITYSSYSCLALSYLRGPNCSIHLQLQALDRSWRDWSASAVAQTPMIYRSHSLPCLDATHVEHMQHAAKGRLFSSRYICWPAWYNEQVMPQTPAIDTW